MAMGGSYQQEADLISLYKDVAKAYVHMVTVPEQLPDVVDRAVRIALVARTVTANARRGLWQCRECRSPHYCSPR